MFLVQLFDSYTFATPPSMAHAAESASLWDILSVCGITHSFYHHTCIGTGKNGYLCNNHVPWKSRGNALHQLEVLFECSPDNSLVPKLQYVAGLLFCKLITA